MLNYLVALAIVQFISGDNLTGVTTPAAPDTLCTGTTNGTSIIWVAQSSAGAADGTSAANARAMTFFEDTNSWASGAGSGTTDIDPGDTVCFTGTITEAIITPAGSGSSGNYVTIDATNATISNTSVLTFGNRSWNYWTHFTWADGADVAVSCVNCFGALNNVIDDFYADELIRGLLWLNSAASITIQNSWARTAASLNPEQGDLISSQGGADDIIIQGNYLEMRLKATTPECPGCHDDVIQNFQGGCGGGSCDNGPRRWTIRYNHIVMNTTEDNDRSWTMLENNEGDHYIYGNVFEGIDGAEAANGLSGGGQDTYQYYVYNNTFVAKSGPTNIIGMPVNTTFTNNIIDARTGYTGCASGVCEASIRTYNLWNGSAVPACDQTGEVCDDPDFTDYANANYSLQVGSPARDSGLTLSPVVGQTLDYGLCPGATWPNPSLCQRTGTWDMGAYVQ